MGFNIVLAGASSGNGHLQAAQNIKKSLAVLSPTSTMRIVDVLNYLPGLDRFLLKYGWEFLSLHLKNLYRILHKSLTSSCEVPKILYKRYSLPKYDLTQMCEKSTNIFIATHPIAVIIGGILKEVINFKLCAVATDFYLHGSHLSSDVDYYYVPPGCSYIGKTTYIRVAKEKSVETGIPLSTQYWKNNERVFNEKQDFLTVLISFGGSGLCADRNSELIKALLKEDLPLKFHILAGNNRDFYDDIMNMCQKDILGSKVELHGFVQNTASLMDNADIFLGKAGGLTLSEALAKELPIGIIDRLPGQEDYNSQYIVGNNLGVAIQNYSELLSWIKSLLAPGVIPRLREKASRFGRPNSSEAIAKHIIKNVWS